MSNMMRFDPFNDIVDDLFKGFLVRPMYAGERQPAPRMNVDVAEKNGAYLVSAVLPGAKKEDIQITIDGAQVTLSAEIKRARELAKDERALHTERMFGKVTRSFTLPQELDEAKAEATFENGVLELTLPKKQPAQRKQIVVQ
jgi:HSP20 family protein